MNIKQFASEYGIDLDEDGYGRHAGRQVRYLEHLGLFQVGSEDFDRWANSEEFEFDVLQKKGQRALQRWLSK